jgi:hypothetical protein
MGPLHLQNYSRTPKLEYHRTRNNIKHLLKIKKENNEKYNQNGIYQLQCTDCPGKYVGQMAKV